MNFIEALSDHSLISDETEGALRMLELTQQDIASIGQAENRFVDLLRQYTVYSNSPDQSAAFAVHYADPADPSLMHLREQSRANR